MKIDVKKIADTPARAGMDSALKGGTRTDFVARTEMDSTGGKPSVQTGFVARARMDSPVKPKWLR